MIKIRNVCKSYTLGVGEVKALDNVCFDLPGKGLFFVLGKSGSGKSTLLNVLGGLDKADSGSVVIDGNDILKFGESELDGYRNGYCGFVFQEFNLLPMLNVEENVRLGLSLQGEKDTGLRVKEALASVELSGYEGRNITELSGGQKQRVAIARAIVKGSSLILADEPTGALDKSTGEKIFQLLKKVSEDKAVIVVTHDREAAQKYGDRIIELSDGKIIEGGEVIEEKKEVKKPICRQPKMPLKLAVKMGCSSFKRHVARFVATVLLCALAFSFFSVALNVLFTNNEERYLTAVYSDDSYVFMRINKFSYYQTDQAKDLINVMLGTYKPLLTKDETMDGGDVRTIRAVYNHSLIPVKIGRQYAKGCFGELTASQREEMLGSEQLYMNYADGFAVIGEDTLNKLGFTVTEGRLPASSDEIAITVDMYRCFEFCGYVDGKSEDSQVVNIDSPSNLLDKYISIDAQLNENYKKIVGIIDTGCGKECHDSQTGYSFKEESDEEYIKKLHQCIFVCEGYTTSIETDGKYSYLFAFTDRSNDDFRNLVRFASERDYVDGVCFYSVTDKFSATKTSFNVCENEVRNICLYIGAIMLIISTVMLTNSLSIFVKNQYKQAGLLKAMGASRGGIRKIYVCDCLIIGLISYILSAVLSVGGVALLNSLLMSSIPTVLYRLIAVSPLSFVITFCLCCGCALIGGLASLAKRSWSAAEIMRRGELK